MANDYVAHGTQLQRGDAQNPEHFYVVGNVNDFDGLQFKQNMVDITHHDSGGWDEFLPTTLTAGKLSFNIGLDLSDNQMSVAAGLYYDFVNKYKRNFKMVLPYPASGNTAAFSAYVEEFKIKAPVKGAINADLVLQTTGSVSWT